MFAAQGMPPISEGIKLVEQSGLVGVLVAIIVFVIWSGIRGHWVFGWTYREMKQDRDGWRASATRMAKLEGQIKAVDSVVEPPK